MDGTILTFKAQFSWAYAIYCVILVNGRPLSSNTDTYPCTMWQCTNTHKREKNKSQNTNEPLANASWNWILYWNWFVCNTVRLVGIITCLLAANERNAIESEMHIHTYTRTHTHTNAEQRHISFTILRGFHRKPSAWYDFQLVYRYPTIESIGLEKKVWSQKSLNHLNSRIYTMTKKKYRRPLPTEN